MADNNLHESGLQIKFNALGHEQITVSTTAVGLPNLPDLARLRRVVIRNLNQPVVWRDDGTDPTPSAGMKALTDEILVYDGSDFASFKMIRFGAVDADVRIAYYGL